MNTERDRFLTEVMGECWHEEDDAFPNRYVCIHCKRSWPFGIPINNFSTWVGFGKLWERAQKQEWWAYDFWAYHLLSPSDGGPVADQEWFVHPDRFANAVYEFLKARCVE